MPGFCTNPAIDTAFKGKKVQLPMLSFGEFSSELKPLTLKGLQASPAYCKLCPPAFHSSHIGHLFVSWTPHSSSSELLHQNAPFTDHDPLPTPSFDTSTSVFTLSFRYPHITYVTFAFFR